MKDEIRRLTATDYAELLSFLDRAFAKPTPQWFAENLPAIYQPFDHAMRCSFAVRHEGKLAGVVGVFPITWHVGGTALRVAGIGGVATAPEFRGTGLMRRLMDHVTAEIRRGGYDLSYLGGQRQRYRYWGWERAGCEWSAQISAANLRHHFGPTVPVVELVPFTGEPAVVRELKQLHDAQPTFGERPADRFTHHLRQWTCVPRIARTPDGRVAGYIVEWADGKTIHELVATDPGTAMEILRAAVVAAGGVRVLLRHRDHVRVVSAFAESISIQPAGNWQIFDWPKVLTALLQGVAGPDGAVTIQIRDRPQTLRVEPGRCVLTDESPDLTLDSPALVALLCGPLKPSDQMPLPHSAAILDAWCPLPLALSPQDHV